MPALSGKGRALRYLAMREHSRAELARKLPRHVEDSPDDPADARIQRALDELGSRYHGPTGERLAAVMRNPVAAPDGEACWAINTLTHTSTQLSPDHAEAIARMIWGGQ